MVYQVPLVAMRGEHAHKECHQFLVCARGSVYVNCDDGKEKKDFILSHPTIGLYIPPKVWSAQFNYSPDALLLVFASHYYENEDYIRDYGDFQSLVGLK
jgi:dTDP-4-dehydrorhamnose 3,5-epimerase-like enzyme